MPIELNTASRASATTASSSPRLRPAQRAHAASTCGIASCSAKDSMTLRGSQLSRNVCTLAGLIRNGRP
jgi:hypothetical protein